MCQNVNPPPKKTKLVLYCPLLSNAFNHPIGRNVCHVSPGLSTLYFRTVLVLEISLNKADYYCVMRKEQ